MSEFKMTKARVKRIIDSLPEINAKSFPKNSVNDLFRMQYKDCNLEERYIDFETVIPDIAINRVGSTHGGYVAGIVDEAMGVTTFIFSNTQNSNVTTTDMQFRFMKALFPGDKIRVRIKLEHSGAKSLITTAEVYRGKDKCVIASEGWIRLDIPCDKFAQFDTVK